MSDDLKTNPCEDIAELCALATTESLTAEEWERLQLHVAQCGSCASLLHQYRALISNEIAALAVEQFTDEDSLAETEWNHATAKQRLLISIRERSAKPAIHSTSKDARLYFSRCWNPAAAKNILRIAAILLVAATTAYWFGFNAGIRRVSADSSSMAEAAALHSRLSSLLLQNTALEARLTNEKETTSRLQFQASAKEKELSDLKTLKSALESQLNNLTSQNQQQSTSLALVSGERMTLEQKMHDTENLIRSIRQQLQSSEDDRHQLLLRTASLESQSERISAQLRDQQDNSNRQQQFLAEDRDIRELMGARQLYIADVFDVDPQGKNKKPYGRVFFTKGKSLIFYAFDLDQQPGYRNASAFQAWGSPGSQANPISLGIFYMDSQANRRWVLQATDPRVLDQISAVFVTVEPKGGSKEPTNKPFLLAYLHATPPNHP